MSKDDQTKAAADKAKGKSKTIPSDFLHPKSMLTPGICGGITLLITNTLVAQFGFPPNYTGLAISCLFGLLAFKAAQTPAWLKFVYWTLNSLIIFSIALGTNETAARRTKPVVTANIASHLPPITAMLEPERTNAWLTSWLDHTVSRRAKLLDDVTAMREEEARLTLQQLGWTPQANQSPKIVLTDWIAQSRTSDSLLVYEQAVHKTKP